MKLTYVQNIQPASPKYPNNNKRAEVSCGNSSMMQTSRFDMENFKNNQVSFLGIKTAPTPYLKSTYEGLMEFHKEYVESLREVPFKSIVSSTHNIMNNTGHSRNEVLSAMQKLTQFANMNSLNTIVDSMNKHQISYIGNSGFYIEVKNKVYTRKIPKEFHDVIHDGVGLHRSLTYLLEHKGFGVLPKVGDIKIAYILDKQKVSQLEKLKEKYPERFKMFKNVPEIKFFMISGWDTGITFTDRTKSLERETINLLKYSDKTGIPVEKAIDEPLMKRIKSLGITPIVISRDGVATEQCVYNQMKPERMTKGELINIVDANSQIRTDDYVKRLQTKNDTLHYLKKQLKVYTPETMCEALKTLRGKILDNAQKRGFKPEDILYIEPEQVKSNSLITYMYKTVNHLPDEQFANIGEVRNGIKSPVGKIIVYVDDCTITGESINDTINNSIYTFNKKQPKIYACMCGTFNANHLFNNKNQCELVIGDYIRDVPTYRQRLASGRLNNAVGNPNYIKGDATCLILPYMAPDNNTEFASNIALFHNSNYRMSSPLNQRLLRDPHKRPSDPGLYVPTTYLRHDGIKNFTKKVDTIAKVSHKLMGSTPQILEEDFKTIKKRYPRKWTDYFKMSTYDEMFEELFMPNPL